MRDIVPVHAFDSAFDSKDMPGQLNISISTTKSGTLRKSPNASCTVLFPAKLSNGLTIYNGIAKVSKLFSSHCHGVQRQPHRRRSFLPEDETRKQFFHYAKMILDVTVKEVHAFPRLTYGSKMIILLSIHRASIWTRTRCMYRQNHIQCNDIFEIRDKYGIEAARALLLKRNALRAVL